MKKSILKNYFVTGILFISFIVLISLVMNVDVKAIGPENSTIGLAALNKAVFDYFKVNMVWYHITDWIGVIAIIIAFSFAVIGLIQLIKQKSIKKVDSGIILLGINYVLTIGSYLFFEFVIINYRPIILGRTLASSFPSSTTLTVVSIMGTAIIQFIYLFKQKKPLKIISIVFCGIIIGITVIGRLISGVHWFTDIIGGILLGSTLIMFYYSLVKSLNRLSHDSNN